MDVRVQSVKFDADSKLIDFATTKVEKLDRFFDGILGAEVTMSLTPDHTNKKVTIRLEVPGHDLHVEKHATSFEEAILQGVDVLKTQITKAKEKMRGV